jgi:hypothetical protein
MKNDNKLQPQAARPSSPGRLAAFRIHSHEGLGLKDLSLRREKTSVF